MASISREPGGRRTIQFIGGDGKRRSIRLGLATQRAAESAKIRIEQLVAAVKYGNTLDEETERWVADLDDSMHAKLAAVGLVTSRDRTAVTLGKFLADYFDSLAVKPGTATAYGHTRRYLIGYFGASRAVRSIDPADADKWRQCLKESGLSSATISRRVGVARQIFRKAIKWGLIRQNPFADVAAGSQANKARQFFVSQETAEKVLDACPDAEWRLLFALSRYGGLRCPSEHLALKWADVDWARNRIRVPSCKTEHHDGGDCRYIPLFPELLPHLRDVFEAADPGTEYVITRCRDRKVNLRTQFGKIIKRAGVSPWPKLFHNLRATRQTELAETYPIHVVCAWLGNSRAVAQEHYLQVTDAHFMKAVQNPVQYPSETAGIEKYSQGDGNPQTPSVPTLTDSCNCLPGGRMGAGGFEPPKA